MTITSKVDQDSPRSRRGSDAQTTTTTTRPSMRPAHRLARLGMTKDSAVVGLSYRRGWLDKIKDHDISRFRTGTRSYVTLTHPEYVDHVLHAGRLNYHKSYEYELLRALLGVSLFTDEEESWQRYRTMLSPMFSKRHLNGLVDLMIEPIDALSDELGEKSGRVEIDMVREMVELTLNVVGNALFSQQFGPIAKGMGPMVTGGLRFGEKLLRVFMISAPPKVVWRATSRLAYTPLPLPPPFRDIQKIVKLIDGSVWTIINERRAHPIDTPDLLNHLLGAADDQGGLPMKRVRDEAITLMLAGHETTANALSWMWYLLALHPDARNTMLDEVDSVLQGRAPTADDLPRLPWTTAVFLEAMRYFSPAWVIPRVAVRDDVIGTHHIKKGTTVIIPAHLVHHDARWWPNPEEFDPSRFLPGAGKDRPRSAYLPFGGGRRVCIGQSFATMESVLIIAILSQRYVFDLVPGHPVDPEATLTLRPRHGLKMIVRRRGITS
ncbi:cytochrome P450 [Antrihabitans spumae]